MKTGLLLFVVLILAGCAGDWKGPVEITMKSGTVVQCPNGISIMVTSIVCKGSEFSVIRMSGVREFHTK